MRAHSSTKKHRPFYQNGDDQGAGNRQESAPRGQPGHLLDHPAAFHKKESHHRQYGCKPETEGRPPGPCQRLPGSSIRPREARRAPTGTAEVRLKYPAKATTARGQAHRRHTAASGNDRDRVRGNAHLCADDHPRIEFSGIGIDQMGPCACRQKKTPNAASTAYNKRLMASQ